MNKSWFQNIFKFKKLNLLIIFLCSNLVNISHAEEHGAPESSESASEGQEGKEGKGSFIKKDEYLELNSSVEQLSAKIKSRNEDLKKILLEREKVKDSAAFKEAAKQIEAIYREIKELNDNIEKKRTILKHRFPERSFVKSGDKSNLQKVEEMGSEALLEKQVEQLLSTVEAQYKFTIRKNHPKTETLHRSPASESPPSPTNSLEQNPYDFSHSLILKK